MKYRNLLIAVMALLVAVVLFLPNQHWWAAMALLSVGGGIYHERRQRYLEAKAAAYDEEEDSLLDVGQFCLFCILAFVIGIGWSLLNSLRWWSLLVAVVNVVVFVLAYQLSKLTTEEAEKKVSKPAVAIQ